MKKTQQYFEGKRLVLILYSVLFLLVTGALADLFNYSKANFRHFDTLAYRVHISLFVITLLLLLFLGFIVCCNLNKIKKQYQSLLNKEQSLTESEANLRTILDNTNTSYYLMDTSFEIIDFNQLSVQLVLEETGKKLKKGGSYLDYIQPERQDHLLSLYKKTLADGEINTQIKTGMGKCYKVNMKRIVNQNGLVLGLCIASTDITEMKKVQNDLKDSEQLYRLIFYSGPSPKWVVNTSTLRFLDVNEQAIIDYGYSRQEFLEMSVYDIRKSDTHQEIREMLANGTYGTIKNKIVHHVKKNGETKIVQISLYPIHYKGTQALMAISHDVTELLRLQEQLSNEKLTKQMEITRATIQGQEKERAELGKELHDNINQLLTSAKLYLETSLVDEQRRIPFLEKGRDLVLTGINEIRKISRSLVPPSLGELTLKDALEEMTLPAKNTGRNIYLYVDDLNEEIISEELKIGIYRIAQEAFNNCIKYANATQIYISLSTTDGLLALKIKDNGKGFDLVKKRNGIGITNMTNRVSVLNGSFEIDTAPEKGCTIRAFFRTGYSANLDTTRCYD